MAGESPTEVNEYDLTIQNLWNGSGEAGLGPLELSTTFIDSNDKVAAEYTRLLNAATAQGRTSGKSTEETVLDSLMDPHSMRSPFTFSSFSSPFNESGFPWPDLNWNEAAGSNLDKSFSTETLDPAPGTPTECSTENSENENETLDVRERYDRKRLVCRCKGLHLPRMPAKAAINAEGMSEIPTHTHSHSQEGSIIQSTVAKGKHERTRNPATTETADTESASLRLRGGCSGSDDGGDPFLDWGTTYSEFCKGKSNLRNQLPNLPGPSENPTEYERRYPFSHWQSLLAIHSAESCSNPVAPPIDLNKNPDKRGSSLGSSGFSKSKIKNIPKEPVPQLRTEPPAGKATSYTSIKSEISIKDRPKIFDDSPIT